MAPLEPAGADVPRAHFARGKVRPRAVAWFGIQSFYGHLWHLAASAIATQDIDSRDWMHADNPEKLTMSVALVIDPGAPQAASITEALGRDLFIDYVADTGDDSETSRAVAELLARSYEVPADGATLLAPRGDILVFGGDTAYPVATASEIEARVLTPWNGVLGARDDGKKRVLLGIPGNHDWFDGLDGFARMFRRRPRDTEPRAPVVAVSHIVAGRVATWAREFVRGGAVEKPNDLVLDGYTPVQSASHFALPLAPSIDLLAVDRQ